MDIPAALLGQCSGRFSQSLSSTFSLSWAIAGVPLGVYNIADDFNIALQIQPDILIFLSLWTWSQCKYYGDNWGIKKIVPFVTGLAIVLAGAEYGLVYALRLARERGHIWPSMLMAIVAAILLASGVLRHYVQMLRSRSDAGVSLKFATLDLSGDVASLLSHIMETAAHTRTRSFGNRNRHPCDFCRYKRAACLLPGPPPCELCRRQGKECTFVEGPNKRRRVAERAHNPSDDALESPTYHIQAPSDTEMRSQSGEMSSPLNEMHFTADGTESASLVSPTGSQRECPDVSLPASLDAKLNHNAQVIGLSGESDPYLLQLYQFDEKDECEFQQLRIRNMGMDDGVPVQFMLQNNSLASRAQPGDFGASESDIRNEVLNMVSEDVGRRLLNLFWRYVQPYFPILSVEYIMHDNNGDPSTLPTSLAAAICGHALPFCVFDDKLCVDVYTPPSADRLFKLAWMAALSQFHTPSLATVQTMLLLIQRRPTNRHVADTPFKWVMLADTVALAQCLGLNLDPSEWSIPPWEKRLRRRLAWAVYVQDRWLSLNFGRSSHIQDCDWDVSSLGPEDFGSLSGIEDGPAISKHFLHLASLTEIVSKIQLNMLYACFIPHNPHVVSADFISSVKATRALSKSLEASFEVARPLRIELAQWSQDHPDVGEQPSPALPHHGLDGNGSLRLAYITAKVAVFKALLRPKSNEAPAEARAALRTGAMAVAREMYDFLAKLGPHHLEAFWHSYSRVNFAIASNFIVLLFALSPTLADAEDALTLLTQWRSLLRIKSRSCDLLNLSLLRLDATFVAGLEKLIELTPAAAEAVLNRKL
ncbi:fungal specific transcription factor domain protein [Colletotrichum asianum]|uniref:Fungal specific transcription factor domain protein n=1 Tax=Colletotrichum asianum TaxID=702518 RepID=A0A8H3WD72_9PEZI|nr:fungal specific transcription factor domain protein [Colletotrichum asianum]